MKIGYARVSTDDQKLDLQQDALIEKGCEKIYSEHISSGKSDRPELVSCLKSLRPHDILVVWRLDRLGRSLKELIDIVNQLDTMQCGLISIKENIDTTSPTGRLVFHLFASLAQFERELIQERTKAGLAAARSRGKIGGRPEKLTLADKTMIQSLITHPETKMSDLVERFGVSRNTLYRVAKEDLSKHAEKRKK
jgi:DNA invertase Pin-like site-specific DNA recombinase